LVIGYDVWQAQFAGATDIVGRQVRLNGVSHTVVGVMPPEFTFPVNHHYWVPLNDDALDRVIVFGRLASSASLEGAQAEAQTMGLIERKPETGPGLQARVVPYVTGIAMTSAPGIASMILPLVLPLLLLPPCINIAILIYARTVARQGEFAARTALGAGRGRIVGQILIEVLLLAIGAAGVALFLASRLLYFLRALTIAEQAFWMDFTLSYKTIVFAAGLAVIAAMIAGGIPAIRATGRWKMSGLHALRGTTAPELGKIWTALVVVQIVLAVAVVPTVAQGAWSPMRASLLGPGFAASEFLTARLAMDRQTNSTTSARFNAVRAEMLRQVRSEPGVDAVTMSTSVPIEEPEVLVEVDLASAEANVQRERKYVLVNQVDEAFLDTFHIPLLLGRRLEAGDLDPARGGVLINRTFAHRILGDRDPLGLRVRVIASEDAPVSASTPEDEIVGVVEDLFAASPVATMYRLLDLRATVDEVRLTMHVGRTNTANLIRRLPEIAAALDPSLRLDDIQKLDEVYWYSSIGGLGAGVVLASLTLCGILSSMAGLYTSMAFTVVQKRREIGIRSALGAPPFRLIAEVFRKMLLPVAIGLPLGGIAAVLLNFYLSPLLLPEGEAPVPWILPASELFIVLIAALALVGPTRRALHIDSVEALRDG
jgi:predicted permease